MSLLELLGVLAVMMIIALAIAPALLRQIDQTARVEEERALSNVVAGLQRYILRTHTVPSPTNMPVLIASELGWRLSDVTTNNRGRPRSFLVDPDLRLGTNTGTGLPYAQGELGSTNPAQARLLVASSISAPLPSAMTAGNSLSSNLFGQLWTAPVGAAPAGWTQGGNWNDIRLHRLQLEPLFAKLSLMNWPGESGRFGVDGTASRTLPVPTATFSAHYLKGTAVQLRGSAADDNTNLQSVEVLGQEANYVFINGLWRGCMYLPKGSRKLTGDDLQEAYEMFIAAAWNVNAKNGVTQLETTTSMVTFMSNYIVWANGGFANNQRPQAAQTEMADDAYDLIWKSSSQ